MEGRFTLALVRAGRSRLARTGAIALVSLVVAPMLATSLQRQAQAQEATQPANVKPGAINPAPPSVRRPDLELGRQGGAVAELQAVLQLLGFYRGEVNGLYNEATSLAVVRFQKAAKLPQTGRVSSKTWNALFPLDQPSPAIATAPAPKPAAPAPKPPVAAKPAAPPVPKPAASKPAPAAPKPAAAKPAAAQPAAKPAAKPNPYPTLKLGEKGDAVARLQRQLNKKGFLEGQPDGAFGPMTEEAVKEAQEALGLEIDGVVGPATWRALLK